MTYTDGSVIKQKDDNPPPLSGSGVYKPGVDTTQHPHHLQLHIKPNGHGPTNTITKAELVEILVALQHEQTKLPQIAHPASFKFQIKPSIPCE